MDLSVSRPDPPALDGLVRAPLPSRFGLAPQSLASKSKSDTHKACEEK